MQKPKCDLNTLIQLYERKSHIFFISRTPVAWTVAGKDPETAAVEYQSIEDCLLNFIIGSDHHGGRGQ